MPKYSFLVPAYNSEKYIRPCIDSLINQSYFGGDYEIVIVDDGSTDSTSYICKEYSSRHDFVTVIYQKNKGLLQARKAGVQASKGDYLIFVDSDDYVNENMLSIIAPQIDTYKPDFMIYSYYRNTNNNEKAVYLAKSKLSVLSQWLMLKLFIESDDYNGIAGCKIVRAAIMKKNLDEIYAYSFNIGEDKLQTAYLLKYSNNILITRDCLYHYVIREDSLIHKKTFDDLLEIVEVYKVVRSIVEKIIIVNKTHMSEKDQLLKIYDTSAVQGVMEHIFKYNNSPVRKLKVKSEGLEYLKTEESGFFNQNIYIYRLKFYNWIRYLMIVRGHVRFLVIFDWLLWHIKAAIC